MIPTAAYWRQLQWAWEQDESTNDLRTIPKE
jgi:hypothetical protein